MLSTVGGERLLERICARIARIRRIPVGDVTASCALVEDLGMASLDLAQLVAELEIELGVDPFAIDTSVNDVRTVGDLCRAYARHTSEP